jgi:hypothetical protein
MSVSVLLPVLLNSEGVSEVMFVDFSTMEVYRTNGEIADQEKSQEVVSELISQQEASMPEVPYDQIRDVMNTERNLHTENAEHVFRRNY